MPVFYSKTWSKQKEEKRLKVKLIMERAEKKRETKKHVAAIAKKKNA